MKFSPADIARALVDALSELPVEKHDAEIQNAIMLHKRYNPGKQIRTFPTLVERMLKKKGKLFTAELVTPKDASKTEADAIADLLATAIKQDVTLDQSSDPSLIGGAVLHAGDERFDLSVKGSLVRLKKRLTSTLSL